jgi:septum formation protein
MKTHAPLILASQSPRRQQLLAEMDLEFEVVVRPVEEDFPPDLSPEEVAIWIAENKARVYAELAADHIVITADTVVALGNKILGKPGDFEEAFAMLRELSGQTHEVITGVSLLYRGELSSFAEITEVTFRELQDEEIRFYVENYPPYDKAGAYGIQDWIGKVGISGIKGDYYNVMGLPTNHLYQQLQQFFV